jgi:hypothetical protein
MKTGELVNHFGLYSSDCCNGDIELEKLDIFPACPTCCKRTNWDCVEIEVLAEAA